MVVTVRAIPASATSKPYFLCLWVLEVLGKERAKRRLCAEQTWLFHGGGLTGGVAMSSLLNLFPALLRCLDTILHGRNLPLIILLVLRASFLKPQGLQRL